MKRKLVGEFARSVLDALEEVHDWEVSYRWVRHTPSGLLFGKSVVWKLPIIHEESKVQPASLPLMDALVLRGAINTMRNKLAAHTVVTAKARQVLGDKPPREYATESAPSAAIPSSYADIVRQRMDDAMKRQLASFTDKIGGL